MTCGFPHKRAAVPNAFLYHDCYYVVWMRGCHFLDLTPLTPKHSTRRRWVNTLRPRQNDRHFADDISKCISSNKNGIVSINISQNFVPKCSIYNIPALAQINAWRLPGGMPLSEPMIVCILMHICVSRPRWVKWNTSWPWIVYLTVK